MKIQGWEEINGSILLYGFYVICQEPTLLFEGRLYDKMCIINLRATAKI